MSYDFANFKNNTKEVEEWLQKEFTTIRTGMASPALLDGIKVENYGSMMPLNQVANIGSEDARTLMVSPWDASVVKDIEKAITDADLGVGVAAGSSGVRVSFPELTSERRVLLVKSAKDKLEKARVSLRSAREDTWSEIQKQEKDGEINEDDKFKAKEDMQKIVDEVNIKLDQMFAKKEEEISI